MPALSKVRIRQTERSLPLRDCSATQWRPLNPLVTCPSCERLPNGLETMPTDACLFYYECLSCHALLRPKPGHCCVFCSYGTVVCPPMQGEEHVLLEGDLVPRSWNACGRLLGLGPEAKQAKNETGRRRQRNGYN